MNAANIEKILDTFVASLDEIQDAVMISAQGHPLTNSHGISHESILLLANKMMYLTDSISEVCQWKTDWVIIQTQEGYLILAQCSLDAFLLIQSTAAPTGFLLTFIQRYIEKLQSALQFPCPDNLVIQSTYCLNESLEGIEVPSISITPVKTSSESHTFFQETNPFFPIHLTDLDINYCQEELAEKIGPIASLICNRVQEENPNLRWGEFIHAISQHIPDQKTAMEFRKHLLSDVS